MKLMNIPMLKIRQRINPTVSGGSNNNSPNTTETTVIDSIKYKPLSFKSFICMRSIAQNFNKSTKIG